MAGLAHLGVGLAAKPFAPNVNVGWLILGNEVLDILWGGFYAVGLETAPGSTSPGAHAPWWDHSLLMAVVWSILFGILASWLGRRSRKRTHIGVVFGLMVFAHWVLDWITHPMTAIIPSDKGLPLVGLGLYRSAAAILPTEAGFLVVGATVYIIWRIRNRRARIAGAAA
jgi:hypothetical protein